MRIFVVCGVILAATVLTAVVLLTAADGSAEITIAGEWNSPQELPDPVNSPGWEDSPQISADGNALYFTYFRIDPILWGSKKKVRLGPMRPDWPKGDPFETYGAELYVARKVNGQWQTPQHLGPEINLPEDAEGDVWISTDERRILFTNGDGSPKRKAGIYFAEKQGGRWGRAVLASSVGFPFEGSDENPHLTADEQTLFWESSRRGGRGKQDIWISRKVNGQWGTPVNAGPNVNAGGTDGSPFSLDGKVLYWDDKGGGNGISRAVLQPDGTWSKKERVVKGYVGDPSLTQDGDLYFSSASEIPGGGGYNSSIMIAAKAGKAITTTGAPGVAGESTSGTSRKEERPRTRRERR
jgi:hypothetical protein